MISELFWGWFVRHYVFQFISVPLEALSLKSTAPWLKCTWTRGKVVVGKGGSVYGLLVSDSCAKFLTKHDLAGAECRLKFKRIAFPCVLLKLVCQGYLIKRNLSLVASDPYPESRSPPFDVEDTGQQTISGQCVVYFMIRMQELTPISWFCGEGSIQLDEVTLMGLVRFN